MEFCDGGQNCMRASCDGGRICIGARWNFLMVAEFYGGKAKFCDGGRNCMVARWNFVTVYGIVWRKCGIF